MFVFVLSLSLLPRPATFRKHTIGSNMYILIKVKYANVFPLPPYQIKSASLFSEDLGGEFIPDTDDISNSYEGGTESDMGMVRRW